MAKLFNIFARKVESNFAMGHAGENELGAVSFREKNGILDSRLFGDLGEKTNDIRAIFTDLDSRLQHVDALTSGIADLRQKFGHFLGLYHDLALFNVSLGREKERLEASMHGIGQRSAQLEEDNTRLRTGFDESQAKLEKSLANIEAYEQNVQLLGVAKRELEAKLHEAQSALALVVDEENVLRREYEALIVKGDSDEQRIADLSERYRDSSEQATSLRERCQALESELRLKEEHLAAVRDENVRLAHEAEQLGKERIHLEKLVNDSRSEISAGFDRYQKDVRLKDDQIGDLKNELKSAQSQEHLLQKANADLRNEKETVAKELRNALEIIRQNEALIARHETKISRLAADGEAALTARKQLDQARLALINRVEALTQALKTDEVDIRRLENEVSGLTQKNQDMETSHAASLEQLNLRIHELEGQLEHQMHENAYLSSKFANANRL